MSLRAFLVVVVAVFAVTACKTKPKSRASIYQGDAPTVHYHETESAGGVVRTTHYR